MPRYEDSSRQPPERCRQGIFPGDVIIGIGLCIRDASLEFFTLGSRGRLKALLLVEGERLAAEIDRVATELKPRVLEALPL